MFLSEGWREKTWSLPFLIFLKRARNTLTGSGVCSLFSPKKTVIKILSFLFPVCELVCTQLLAAACSTAPPCLLPLLLALGWPLNSLSSSSSNTALPQGFSLSTLGSFSEVPCLLWLDDFTALFLFLLTLHTFGFPQSHSSAFICFFDFLSLYSWAKDTVVLHKAGPGYRQLTLEPWFSCWLWGENQGSAEQLQCQVSPGMAPPGTLAVQGSVTPPREFNSDLEHTT